LGAVLVDPACLPVVAGLLAPGDFYRQEHQAVFRAMCDLQAEGRAVDTLTVWDRLGGDGAGPSLLSLLDAVPTSLHAEHYAALVAALAARRRLADAGAAIVRLAYDEARALPDAEDAAMEALVAARPAGAGRARTMPEAVRAYYDELEALARSGKAPGVPTGFPDLDAVLGGLHKSDLVYLAARPSVGKTSLALGVARNAAALGMSVLFHSLEMSAAQLVQRLAALDSGASVHNLREGKLTEEEWPRVVQSLDRLERLPILLDDTPGVTPARLRSSALRARAVAGLDLLVVDYLQLMRPGHRTPGKYEAITEISQSLKELARDLDVPVLAVSQLNRDCETRSDKRPMLSDLRESGALEQDADVVVLLYRDEVYDANTPEHGIAEVHVAKHRNGPTGKLNLLFRGETSSFATVRLETRNIEELRRRRDVDVECL
jgi:replicative DNA helicase